MLQEMAEEGTTAQVHPEKLTRAFLDSALSRGAKLVHGTVQGIALSQDGKRVEGGYIMYYPAEGFSDPAILESLVYPWHRK